jgi:hypothetical protein
MTISEGIKQVAMCPICNNYMDMDRLSKLGLSHNELLLFNEHVRNGTIKEVLSCGDLMLRRIDPEARNIELQVGNAISQLTNTFNQLHGDFRGGLELLINGALKMNGEDMEKEIVRFQEKGDATLDQFNTQIKRLETITRDNQTIQNISSGVNEIMRKIGGTGIGSIGETITIQDLKRAAPMDSFDETRSSKHGTDIIAKINENGIACGTVTVSVKYTQTWSNEYVEQISNNILEDGSKFGILVSKTFPREALNDKAWIMKTREGNSIILVKPEYVPLAYFGLRQATLAWFQTRQLQKTKEQETEEMEKTYKALRYWINGEEFQESIRYIDCAIDETNKTKELMNTLNKHINNKIGEALQCQDHIASKLIKATTFVRKLRELLNGSTDLQEVS